jgi:hypothetical protein
MQENVEVIVDYLLIISKHVSGRSEENSSKFCLNGTSLVKIQTGYHPNTGQQHNNRPVFSVMTYCEFCHEGENYSQYHLFLETSKNGAILAYFK